MFWTFSKHLTNEMTHLVRQEGHKPHTVEPFQTHTGLFKSILPAAFWITWRRQLAALCWVQARQHFVEREVISSTHCLTGNNDNKDSHRTRKCFCLLFSPCLGNQRDLQKLNNLLKTTLWLYSKAKSQINSTYEIGKCLNHKPIASHVLPAYEHKQ